MPRRGRRPAVSRRVLHQLILTLDGKPAAGDTSRRRQGGLNAAIEHAVQTGQLEHDPLKQIGPSASRSPEVDPRVVITHAQARELLTAVFYVGFWDRARGHRLVALFAVLYYARLRPAEAISLREADCQLSERGWGTLTPARTLPVTSKKWTNDGVRPSSGRQGRLDDVERANRVMAEPAEAHSPFSREQRQTTGSGSTGPA